MSVPIAQLQQQAGGLGGRAARGSAVDAVAGLPLVDKGGRPLAPSSAYLQAQADAERHAKLDKAWRYYTGNVHGHFRQESGQPDVNVITNRSASIVDTGVDFLYGKTVTLEVLKDGEPNEAAQVVLDKCWGKDAKRMTLLSKLAQNGGIFGHVFAKICAPYPEKGRAYCHVVPLDPSQVTVITHPEDVDCVLAYIVTWLDTPANGPLSRELATGKMRVFKRIVPDPDDDDGYYDPDATWLIEEWSRGPNNQLTLLDTEEWAHPWAPIVDWQALPLANLHWGQSDIPQNVIHLNSVLNLILSNINANAKYHGFPILSASGMNPDVQLEVGPGKVLKFPSPDASLKALEAFGDTTGLLSFADNVRADMDEQTRVPAVATGRLRDVPRVTSGVAFQMMYGPLLSKNVHKQRLFETGHEELSLRMLSLCGYGDGTGEDGWEVVTHWPSPLPNDDQATAQLALAAKQVGMSDHFICEVLDQDYDEEMQYRQDEAQEAMKAALQGRALPSLDMPPSGAAGSAASGQAPGQPAASQAADQASQGPQPGQAPPTNHPAAVAQRNATAAVARAMKSGKPPVH